FTADNWDTAQTVTVSALQDDDALTDTAGIRLAASGGGYFSIIASLSVSVVDGHVQSLTISPNSMTIEEGGSGTFTVALATRPSDAVTVSLNRTGAAELVLGAFSLSFTTSNWNTVQSVTVNAAEDDDSQTDLAGISLTASGGDYGSVAASLSVSVTDNDTPALALSALSLSLNEGGSGIFTVALTTRPSEAVTVSLVQSGTGNPDVTFSPSSLSFAVSNWSVPQNVTVSAAGDDDALTDSAGLSLTASGADYGSVAASLSVSVVDSDTQALALSVPSLSLSEGGSGTFTVALATRPSAAVTVSLSGSGSGDVSFSPSSLSFSTSNWDTVQSVTVNAAGDDDALGDSASINFSASGGDYAGTTARLPVAVLDNDTQALALSVPSLSLDEGGSGSFTVALTTEPSDAVTVSLTGSGSIEISLSPASLSFSTSNWGTVQSVAVTVGEDDDSLRDDVVINLSASGGDYGDTTGSLSLVVTDNDPPGLRLSASALSVAEGSDGSFTVRLHTQPSEDVTLTLSQAGASNPDVTFDTDTAEAGSQSTLSFTSDNWNSPQSVSVSAAEDDDALADGARISLSASGGEYAGVTGSVSVSVSENDTAALTLSASSLSLDEGGSGSFTVVLDTRPSGPVTVSLAKVGYGDVELDQSVLIFTGANWSTAHTVMVRASQDDDAADDSATVSLTAAGGEYDGLTGSVSIAVTDDDTAALTLSASSLSLNEGASGTFTVVLDTRPSADVTVSLVQPGTGNSDVSISPSSLSFTTDSWNRVQTVVVGAAEDDDAQNDSGSISLTAAGGDYAGKTGSLSVNVDDNDRPGLTLSVFSLTLNEGGSQTFTAVLDTRPSGSVSVALTRTGATGVMLGSSMLTFTDSNWNSPQSITVSAAEDDNGISDSATITLTASGGGYNGVAGALAVSVLDNDTPRLVLSESSLSVDEGGSASFTVRLNTRPSEGVTVSLSLSGDGDVTLSAASLSITTVSWGTPQSVTVSAAEDDDGFADSAKISLTVSGGGYGSVSESVSVLVRDNDTAALGVSAAALTVAEGDSETFTVRLSTRPSDEVTVSLVRSGSSDVTLGSESLSFTTSNWATEQSVTVSAAEDSNGLGETAQIALTASGGGYAGVSGQVSVSVTDNDSPALTLSASSLTAGEGGSATFTAVLDTRPSGAVTINLASIGSGDVTLDQSALIFTISNWDTPQTVTVRAAEDDDAIVDAASITLTAVGGGYGGITASLSVSVTENDAAGLALSETSLTPAEGGSETFTVALAAQPGAAVTVSLTQSGASNRDIGIAPTSLVFTPSNWSTVRSVTVSAAEDDDALDERATISLSAAGGGYGSASGSVSVSVDDDDTVGLSLSSGLLSLDEGAGGSFTVALATRPSAAVSVSLTRNGSAEVGLSRYALSFTQGNWSTPQSVTVSVGEDEDGFADSAVIPLTATGGDYAGISASVSVAVADNDPTALSLSAGALSVTEGDRAMLTVALGTRPSEAVAVELTLTGSDDVTLGSTSLDFTTSNWATIRTIEVIAAEDDDTQVDTAQISLTASGGDYAGIASTVEVTVVDNDAPGLALSTPVLNVVEGADSAFTLALTSQPGGAVTVSLTHTGSDDVTLGATSLDFTASDWDTPQSVTVSAAEDDDALADAAAVSLAALGGGYDGVGGGIEIQVAENDTAALTLSASALTLNEGAGGSFTVALATLPSDTVTVTLALTGDADVSFDSPSLVFTTSDWDTAQTVMVSAAEDDDALADSAAISLSSSGGSYGGVSGRVTVSVSDNDTPGLGLSAASLNLSEGGSATFTVALGTRPSDAVSVSLSQSGSANPDVSLSPASLSFSLSNWNVPQTVTVSAVEDADTQADSATLALAASGGGYGSASGSVSV
ncbi:MAG: hypothetical protein ISN29_05230, partial [Gammaproteobacteria bacterium AqS3]|nr:hypothetical protein [Gammaproteobacteria bacterium AqS3]